MVGTNTAGYCRPRASSRSVSYGEAYRRPQPFIHRRIPCLNPHLCHAWYSLLLGCVLATLRGLRSGRIASRNVFSRHPILIKIVRGYQLVVYGRNEFRICILLRSTSINSPYPCPWSGVLNLDGSIAALPRIACYEARKHGIATEESGVAAKVSDFKSWRLRFRHHKSP